MVPQRLPMPTITKGVLESTNWHPGDTSGWMTSYKCIIRKMIAVLGRIPYTDDVTGSSPVTPIHKALTHNELGLFICSDNVSVTGSQRQCDRLLPRMLH